MYKSEAHPEGFPDGGWRANLVLFGSFMGLIADFGIANSLGAIEAYVSTHQLKDVKQTNVSWVFSLHLGVMYFGGVFFGELFDRFGAKRPLIAGTIIMVVGLFLTAESRRLEHFILSFGILTAIGTSLAMSPLIGAISHWFLKKRGMACSIATIGGLVGASVFAVMLQKLYIDIGFKWAIRTMAFICLFCMIVSIIFVQERTSKIQNTDDEAIAFEQDPKPRPTPGSILKSCISFLRQALDFSILKEQRFVLLTLAVFLSEITSMTTLTYLSSYALNYGVAQRNAFLLITIVNVCGIPSRLATGILADKYGRFNVMIASSICTTIVIFAIWLPARGNIQVLFAFGVLFGISTSAVISLIPACTGQICSAENFGKVYGTMYFFLGFLTILGMYFSSLVINHGTKIDYRNFVLFEGALAFTNIIIWIWARYSSVGWKLCKF
ncbi:monocarboxylate permease [Scheffersomyces xylosifermentans]|uniref:monocarboxylate permease n=1 Tax=Scheffersomyces xylosifermentans TaxID=1304137 RepID=UPI00315DD1FE